ncbi:MAG: hypothetical protein M1831_001186 [Alyxoria varia]|nr:MAG: hypothetical protein M1831_001186 [Alyxoria varia]
MTLKKFAMYKSFFLFLSLLFERILGDVAYQDSIVATSSVFNTEENGVWTLADFTGDGTPDLIYIKTGNTDTGRIEIHGSPSDSQFQEHTLATGTAFGIEVEEHDGTWLMCDYTGDGKADLVYIKTRNTDTGKVEVHVADAASGYQTFVLHTGTCFEPDENGIWTMSAKADLVYIKTRNTASGNVEYHVSSKASNYQAFTQHEWSNFAALEDDGTWCLAPYTHGDFADLYYIKTRNTGTGMVEVHAVSAKSQLKTRLMDVATGFALENNGYWLMIDYTHQGRPDLAYIKTRSTGTGKVEVHVNPFDKITITGPTPNIGSGESTDPPPAGSARDQYIYHLNQLLETHEQLGGKLTLLETASQSADDKLAQVYKDLESHLGVTKVTSTLSSVASIAGVIMLFTPAAPVGAVLMGLGAAGSVGSVVADKFFFDEDASKDFVEVINTYTISSQALQDQFQKIQNLRKKVVASLMKFAAELHDQETADPKAGTGSGPLSPGRPDLPDNTNDFSRIVVKGLVNSAADAKPFIDVGTKSATELGELLGKESAVIIKALPILTKLVKVVPVLSVIVDVESIVSTWTTTDAALQQAAKLRKQIADSVPPFRDTMGRFRSDLDDLVGSKTLQVTLLKLTRLHLSIPGAPGGPPEPPPPDPDQACNILRLMEGMVDVSLLLFANLLGDEHEDSSEDNYLAEAMPEADVVQLSQKAVSAPVVDSLYEHFLDVQATSDADSEDRPGQEPLHSVMGLTGIGLFRTKCKFVEFGNEEVHNVSGTQFDKRVTSWVRFWSWWFRNTWTKRCFERKCLIKGRHSGPGKAPSTWIVGGHMEKVARDRKWYILPICSYHNAPSGTFDRGGESLETLATAWAVQIPIDRSNW